MTICAGNVPPEGMVIASTGNSVICGGSCRSRQVIPIKGAIMVICAQQPIPKDYEIQSVTTSPSCMCLGDDDNAFVIRAANGTLPTPLPQSEFPSQFPGQYPNQPPTGNRPTSP